MWKPKYPNPAFDRRDAADGFWAAKIVSRFTDEMISAIVAAGKISDPEAAAYLTDVLIQRRDKVVQYWISRTNPLDRFDVERCADFPLQQLTFDNAAVRVGAAPQGARYSVRWSVLDNLSGWQQPWGRLNSRELGQVSRRRRGAPPTMWATDIPSRPFVPSIRTTRTGRNRLS